MLQLCLAACFESLFSRCPSWLDCFRPPKSELCWSSTGTGQSCLHLLRLSCWLLQEVHFAFDSAYPLCQRYWSSGASWVEYWSMLRVGSRCRLAAYCCWSLESLFHCLVSCLISMLRGQMLCGLQLMNLYTRLIFSQAWPDRCVSARDTLPQGRWDLVYRELISSLNI